MSEVVAPLINGRRFSYASIELAAQIGASASEIFVDVEEINYDESLVFEFKQGTARVPLGNTSGVWEAQEGSMLMGKSTFNQMIQKIGPGWLGINMIMIVTFVDIGEKPCVDKIVARLLGSQDAHAAGPAALKVNARFMPITPIIRNGVPSMLNRVV